MRDQEKARIWEERLQEWEASGLRVGVWCKQQNLSYDQFMYWRKNLRGAAPTTLATATNWVSLPLPAKAEDAFNSVALTVRFHSGEMALDIHNSAKTETLRMALEVLRELC